MNDLGLCSHNDRKGYWYEMQEDSVILTLDYTSGAASWIRYYFLGESCDSLTCLRYDYLRLNSTEYIPLVQPSSHYLFLPSYHSERIGTTIDVGCIEIDNNATCVNATPLTDHHKYGIHLTRDNCQSDNDNRWYSVEGSDDVISIQFEMIDFSAILIEVYENSCDQSNKIITERIYSHDDWLFNFYAQAGNTYNIRIYPSWCSYGGSIIFDVQRGQQPPNDHCAQAIDISDESLIEGNDRFSIERDEVSESCNNRYHHSIWYQLTGNDSIVSLVYDFDENSSISLMSVKENSCDELLSCPNQHLNSYEFFSEQGETYFLEFRSDNTAFNTKFRKSSRYAAPNSNCTDAYSANCSEVLSMDFTSSLGRLYYTHEGQDDIVTITLEDDNAFLNSQYYVQIWSGSCDNRICVTRPYFRNIGDNFKFVADQGATYYLEFLNELNRQDNAQFSLTCSPRVANDDCEDARRVRFGRTYQGTLRGSSSLIRNCKYVFEGDVWYKLTGDGNIAELNLIETEQYPIELDVYNGDCNEITSIKSVRIANEDQSRITFKTDEDQEYFIRFKSGYYDTEYDFEFEINSVLPAVNDLCTGAIEVSCGDSITDSTHYASISQLNSCFQNSPNLWYKYQGQGEIVQLNITPPENDRIRISIIEGSCSSEQCYIPGKTFYGGSEAKFYFHTAPNVDYYILISGTQNNSISYEFDLSCHDFVANDYCNNAISALCNDTTCIDNTYATPDSSIYYSNQSPGTWTSLEGDGNIYFIDLISSELDRPYYSIYENYGCDSMVYVSNSSLGHYRRPKFITRDGVSYVIYIYGRDYHDRGEVKFTLQCFQPASNDDCSNPRLLTCGDMISVNFDSISADPLICDRRRTHAWYRVEGNGQIHLFQLGPSSFGRYYTTLYETDDCDSLICIEEADNSKLSFLAVEGKDYLVSMSLHNSSQEPPLSFTVDCYDPAPNDQIHNAQALVCDDQLQFSFYDASSDGDTICNNRHRANYLWYSFEGNNQIWNFSSSSSDYLYVDLLIEDESGISCLWSNDFWPRWDTLRIPALVGQKFYIGFTEFSSRYFGEYDINVECSTAQLNDLCTDAIPIQCDDLFSGTTQNMTIDYRPYCDNRTHVDGRPYVWYQLEGDGAYHTLSLTSSVHYNDQIDIYTGSCSDLQCIGSSEDDITFYAYNGSTYFIAVTGRDFQISTSCYSETTIGNDLCEEATSINCDELVVADYGDATIDQNSTNCHNRQTPDIWYIIEGTGDVLEVRAEQNVNSSGSVFTGGCQGLMCLDYQQNIYYNPISFLSEVGVSYYIQFSSSKYNNGSFEFIVECKEALQNDLCEDAITITCGESFDSALDILANDNINDCTNDIEDPAMWFSLTGDGNRYILNNFSSNNSDETVRVYEGNCVDCVEELDVPYLGTYYQPSKYIIDTEEGKEYLIVISFAHISRISRLTFEVQCFDPPPNTSPDSAIPLLCDKNFEISSWSGINDSDIDPCNNFGYALWYSIEGDGLVHELYNLYDSLDAFYQISLLEDTGSGLVCLEDHDWYEGRFRFLAEPGRFYLLRISDPALWSDPETTWAHDCYDPVPNDICTEAIDLHCGEDLKLVSEGAFNDRERICNRHRAPTVWYSIIGKGQFFSFSLRPDDPYVRITIYEGSCGLLDCYDSIYLYPGENGQTFLEADKKYFDQNLRPDSR